MSAIYKPETDFRWYDAINQLLMSRRHTLYYKFQGLIVDVLMRETNNYVLIFSSCYFYVYCCLIICWWENACATCKFDVKIDSCVDKGRVTNRFFHEGCQTDILSEPTHPLNKGVTSHK